MSALVILGGGCGAGDQTIDIIHDPCAPLRIQAATGSPDQHAAIATAEAMWRGRGAPALGVDTTAESDGIELRFEPANGAFRGHYDDEVGLIYINAELGSPALEIVIAHELGHAFGLVHVDDGTASLMTRGNTTMPPTAYDEAALERLWGRCAP